MKTNFAKSESFNISSNLNDLLAEAKEERRYVMQDSRVRWHGLRTMVESAQSDFTAATGFGLPWNMAGPSWAGYRDDKGKLPAYLDKHPIEEFARFSGWLRAASKLPGLAQAMDQVCGAGMNSPGTVNLWYVFRRFPSPGRLNRLIFSTAEKAARILAPYGIRAVRYGSVLRALMGHSPKKAHLWVAAWALPVSRPEWKPARSLAANRGHARWLVADQVTQKLADCLVVWGRAESLSEALDWIAVNCRRDASDGVKLLLDTSTEETHHGIVVVKGYSDGTFDHYGTWLCRQISTGRTYHLRRDYVKKAGEWELESPSQMARRAIKAWREQARLVRLVTEQNQTLMEAVLREDCTILVWLNDSYQAGNCAAGTAAWMAERGWARRACVPVNWLLPFAGEQRVRNILTRLAEQLSNPDRLG